MSTLPTMSRASERGGCLQTREYLRDLTSSLPVPGVKHLGERGRHLAERIYWIVSLLIGIAAACACLYFTYLRWISTPPLLIPATLDPSVNSIPFPAVTLCPETRVRKGVMDVARNLAKLEKQLRAREEFESADQQRLAEAISLQCFDKKPIYTLLLPSTFTPNSTHRKLLETQVTPRLEDLLAECQFASEVSECAEMFRPLMTSYGVCYTFNLLKETDVFVTQASGLDPVEYSKRPWTLEGGYRDEFDSAKVHYPRRSGFYAGPLSGLNLRLRVIKSDIQQTCSAGPPEAIRVYLHLPGEFPRTFDGSYFHVSPGTHVWAALRPDMVTTGPEMRKYAPRTRGCNFPEDHKLRLFATYTKRNCEQECLNDISRKFCGCQEFLYPQDKKTNLTFCSFEVASQGCGSQFYDVGLKKILGDVMKKLKIGEKAALCDCLPGCTQLEYPHHVTAAPAQHPSNVSEDELFASLTIFFEETTFKAHHRSELFGIIDFTAYCGALILLTTGVSLLTLLQLLYFCTLRLACHLRMHPEVPGSPCRSTNSAMSGEYRVNK